jgi:hypothetical protein
LAFSAATVNRPIALNRIKYESTWKSGGKLTKVLYDKHARQQNWPPQIPHGLPWNY